MGVGRAVPSGAHDTGLRCGVRLPASGQAEPRQPGLRPDGVRARHGGWVGAGLSVPYARGLRRLHARHRWRVPFTSPARAGGGRGVPRCAAAIGRARGLAARPLGRSACCTCDTADRSNWFPCVEAYREEAQGGGDVSSGVSVRASACLAARRREQQSMTTDERAVAVIEEQADTTIRREWRNDRWYFAVIDVIALLTDSAAPLQYWRDTKARMRRTDGWRAT